MNTDKLNKYKKWLKNKGYEFENEFWMEDYVVDHKWRDIVELIDVFVNERQERQESKALHVADVRLSCFKEVFEKFKEVQEESDFYQWIYRKSHEA